MTPRPAPRWPPVLATASTVSVRSSPASCLSCSADRFLRSFGKRMRSSNGVLEDSDKSNSNGRVKGPVRAGATKPAGPHGLHQKHPCGQFSKKAISGRKMASIHVKRRAAGRFSIGIEGNPFDPRFGLAQQLLAPLLQSLAALVQRNRLLKRYLASLEILDDRFKLFDRAFEGQLFDVNVIVFGHIQIRRFVTRTLNRCLFVRIAWIL